MPDICNMYKQTQFPFQNFSHESGITLYNPLVTKESVFKLGFCQNKSYLSKWQNPLLIFMEKTCRFLFVAFGNFRNQVEDFSSSWEYPTLGQKESLFSLCFFFPVLFLHLTLVKKF